MTEYEVIIDMGKPDSHRFETMEEMKAFLTKLYIDEFKDNEENVPYCDILIYDGDKEVSEDQCMTEMFAEIMEEQEDAS